MRLIKINQDHYVIVDDLEIKEGEHYINIEPGNPFFGKIYKGVDRILKEGYSGNGYKTPDYFKTWMKKITHSTQPLEGVELLSLSEVKKLIGEVDVEKKAEKFIGCEYEDIEDNIDQIGYDSFIRGYNQALEDNKEKKYTENDLKFALWQFIIRWELSDVIFDIKNKKEVVEYIDDIIQSLQPKTEWEVELIDGQLKLKQ